MTLDKATLRVQFCYPQIYYACHTRHVRRRSSGDHLSARDTQMLVHLEPAGMTVSRLARHMGLAVSTVSEAITRLVAFGYVEKRSDNAADRRRVAIVLTAKAVAAVQQGSVLETARLRRVLTRLSRRQLASAIAGLEDLARACAPAAAVKRRWRDA